MLIGHSRRLRLAIGTPRQSRNRPAAAGQSLPDTALPALVVPFPAAEIDRTRLRDMLFQSCQHAAISARLGRRFGQVDVRCI